MPHETLSDYARRCGVARQTIFKHCEAGRVLRSEKGIDPHLPINMEYEQSLKLKRQNGKSKPSKAKGKKKPAKSRKPSGGNGIENILGEQLDLEHVTRNDAERLKTIEQVLNYQVKTQKERQELVERALVKRIWAKLYAVDTAELHPLGEKIAADLAAKFKSDDSEAILEVRKIVDRHIFKALQHSKRLMDDFLVKIGEEEL